MKYCLVFFLLIPSFLKAQTNRDSVNASLRDSVKILMERVERLESAVYKRSAEPSDRLKDKVAGVEVNPTFLLFGNFSGGIQLFLSG